MTIDKQAIDFSQPLETESGEPVKYICHDVIEYKCARVCVDIATGIVYSSPYVGLKIRNKEANPRSKLREQIESAADAYWQFDNGLISDMKCGDLSHEYLLFAKEPKNVLALLDELESKQTFQQAFFRQSIMYDVVAEAYEEAKEQIAKDVEIKTRLCLESNSLFDRLRAAEKHIAELEAKLETADRLHDSAFRDGLKAGFSYGQTDDQSGFAQCMSAYSTRTGIKVKGE